MDSKIKGYACPRCTVGRCSPREMIFSEVHQGQLLADTQCARIRVPMSVISWNFAQETLEALWQELYGEQTGDATVEDMPAVSQQKRSSPYSE